MQICVQLEFRFGARDGSTKYSTCRVQMSIAVADDIHIGQRNRVESIDSMRPSSTTTHP
jgi:hypothetical protein